MLRSMYSGISGMKVNQRKLDVIGNNISNVGTTAFKGSRVTFSDMLSQTQSTAMSPSANQGGVNGKQIGLGVQLSSIDRVMTQGMMQPTGRALDVAIDGDGFFMVSKGPVISEDGVIEVDHRAGAHGITAQSLATAGSQIMYSRDGAFVLDAEGNLLTTNGFRIMGYSLTNDDNSKAATEMLPNSVNTSGLDFRFGPGAQLNGYKVVLGSVGPGTVTSADINKTEKLVVLSGDFSTPGALTPAQVESAINKGLSANGISQQIFVSGKPISISGLGSDSIKGGSDATAPSSVSVMGVTFSFTEGSDLNEYTIKIGSISSQNTQATVDKNNKVVTIDANFIQKGSVSATDLEEAVNKALRDSDITQEVKATGIISQIAGLAANSDGKGKISKAPDDVTQGSYQMSFLAVGDKGAQLNGYTFTFNENSASSNNAFSIDKDSKKIIVSVGTQGLASGTTAPITFGDINTFLKNSGVNDVELDALTMPTVGSISGGLIVGVGGQDLSAPSSVTIAGLTVKLPKGDKFNNVEVQIASLDTPISPEKPVELVLDSTGTNVERIILKGDFRDQNVQASTLESDINAAILASGIYGVGPLSDSQKVTVGGSPKAIPGLISTTINGGESYSAPSTKTVFGLDFVFGNGSTLNGYRINIGQITAGTKTGVNVDENSKTITINGDFVTSGAVTTQAIQNALNVSLQEKGIEQYIKVSGTPTTLPGTESLETNGGTPVQSLDSDGDVNFVDGTQGLKSYDGSLKTLKIPDKVKIAGTNTELRVKSYNIDKTGVINGILEDGRVAALGQIAMASFKNPEGLASLGGNLYGGSANSGEPVLKSGVGTLQDDNSGGYGENLQGMLEMSNVDLAEQFTDMIVTTKAFQASGKMINTGDEILQEIINLKR